MPRLFPLSPLKACMPGKSLLFVQCCVGMFLPQGIHNMALELRYSARKLLSIQKLEESICYNVLPAYDLW